jgi:Tfp pilus assembly protein PilF
METDVKQFAKLKIVFALSLAMTVCGSKGQTAATADNQRQTAISLEQQGNLSGAEAAWRDVLKVHPADADSYARNATRKQCLSIARPWC